MIVRGWDEEGDTAVASTHAELVNTGNCSCFCHEKGEAKFGVSPINHFGADDS